MSKYKIVKAKGTPLRGASYCVYIEGARDPLSEHATQDDAETAIKRYEVADSARPAPTRP